jgi:hypothetical protein
LKSRQILVPKTTIVLTSFLLMLLASKDSVKHALLAPAKSTAAPMVTHAHFTSTPAGAEIYIDRSYVGVTPLDIDVTCCWHDVTVTHPGLKPWTKRVRQAGGRANIHAHLQK